MTAPIYHLVSGRDPTVVDPAAPVIQWINDERTYRPVSPTTHFAITDSLIFVAHSDSLPVHVFDHDGRPQVSWEVDLPRRAPTDEHVRRDAQKLAAFTPSASARAGIVERHMGLPRPEYLPYHSGLLTDPLGRLWIVESVPGDPMTRLRAYRLDGTLLGIVEVPVELAVFEIGRGHVLGVREDPETLGPKVQLFTFELGA